MGEGGRVGDDRLQFALALGYLVNAYDKDETFMASERIERYSCGCAEYPGWIVMLAAKRVVQGRSWFPRVNELREACEMVRQEKYAEVPVFAGCTACNESGWDTVVVEGVTRVTRCACWKAHQLRVQTLRAPERPALPAGEERRYEDDGL